MTRKKKLPVSKETAPATKNESEDQSSGKILHVFINTYPDTKVQVHHWELERGEDADPERVSVQLSELCYSTILDPLEPKVETWGVTKTGALSKSPIATSGLPFVRELTIA